VPDDLERDELNREEGRKATGASPGTTSEDGVAILERLFDAWNRDDTKAALDLFDPQVEWRTIEGTYYGLDGLVKHWNEWTEPWEDHRVQGEEFIPAGDKVLAVVRVAGRGRLSGVEVGQRIFHVYALRDGRIVELQEYLDRDEALEAVGRRE
jgi:ketosteroid isomerase-like protein